MKTAAVVVDDWKVSIFRRIFDENGFKYEICVNNEGMLAGTTILSVTTDTIAKLQPFVEQANIESAKQKGILTK